MIFACFLFILMNLDLTSPLQWTSSATLANNSTVTACKGQDVELDWRFSSLPEEHTQTVEWYHSHENGTGETFAAIVIGGKLFRSPNITTQMSYVPNAGLRLQSVSSADSGIYTARVTVNLHGSMETHVQRAHVIVREPSSMTTDGQLHVELELLPQFISSVTQDDQLILSCGRFVGDWASNVDVVWKTPLNQTLPSTSYKNGRFLLAVPNPIANGEYRCSIAGSSPAVACLQSSDYTPLLQGASIVVDALEARLALLQGRLQAMGSGKDGRLQSLEQRMQSLEAQNVLMKDEVQGLRANVSALVQEVQSLETENSDLKQRLQEAARFVGFHARKTTNTPTYSLGDIIIFEEVLTNEGGAYNSTSGIFLAPVNGTYVFHVTIVLDRDSPATANRHVKLMVEDTWVAIATSSFKDHFEMGSCHAVVTLTAGQKVYVIADNGDAQFIGTDNTFSGALLHASLAL